MPRDSGYALPLGSRQRSIPQHGLSCAVVFRSFTIKKARRRQRWPYVGALRNLFASKSDGSTTSPHGIPANSTSLVANV